MAACNIFNGITKGCTSNSGGILAVYINDTQNVSYTANTTAMTITAITATPDFSSYEMNKNTGSLVSSTKIDLINGSSFVEHTISLVFNKFSASKHRELTLLGSAQPFLDIIVKTVDNEYFYVPEAQLTVADANSGVARADGQKYQVTFVSQTNLLPYSISEALVTPLIT